MTDPPTGISALTLASVLLSVKSPSINTTRFAMAWRSIEIPVMGADVDIDADHLALADEFQDRRHEQHRAAAGYSRFYDEVGLGCPDDFLGGNYVGRELYDGHAHPAPEVGIVISIRGMQRVHRGLERSAVAAERQGLDTLLFFESRGRRDRSHQECLEERLDISSPEQYPVLHASSTSRSSEYGACHLRPRVRNCSPSGGPIPCRRRASGCEYQLARCRG